MVSPLYKISVAGGRYGNAYHELEVRVPLYLGRALFYRHTLLSVFSFVKIAIVCGSLILVQTYSFVLVQNHWVLIGELLFANALFYAAERASVEVLFPTIVNMLLALRLVKAIFVTGFLLDTGTCCRIRVVMFLFPTLFPCQTF